MLYDKAVIQVVARIGAQLRRPRVEVTDLQVLAHPQRTQPDQYRDPDRQPRRSRAGEMPEQPYQPLRPLPFNLGFTLHTASGRLR
ncbi:hypothetical protein D9M71_472780 [compost metagenome]